MKKSMFIFAFFMAFLSVPTKTFAKQKWYPGNRICVDGKVGKDGLSGRCTVTSFQYSYSGKSERTKCRFDRISGDFINRPGIREDSVENAVLDIAGLYERTFHDMKWSDIFTGGADYDGITFKGTVIMFLSSSGSGIYYRMKAGGILYGPGGQLILKKDLRVWRILSDEGELDDKSESSPYAVNEWELSCFGLDDVNSSDLFKSGSAVVTSSIPKSWLAEHPLTVNAELRQNAGSSWQDNGVYWFIFDTGNTWLKTAEGRFSVQFNNGSYKIQDSGTMISCGQISMINGKMPTGDPVRESAYVELTEKRSCEWDGVIKYDDGVTFKGMVRIVKGKNNNRSYSGNAIPSAYENDPLYFKKLTIADNIVFVNGTRYGPDGNVEETYKDGWSNLEIEAARNRAAIAKQKEQQKQAQARAEKEKNTKATAAFLNSAWGKKFNFGGYHDGNRYVHGSSVLRFSYDRSDIWLDVAGHTYHFLVDGVSDDDGKSIRCREVGTAMPGVYISPIMHNGKRAFKILFVFAELEYTLY